MYRVIRQFSDLQDNSHLYNVGDVFPRDGVKVSAERAEELESSRNRLRVPLIEEVGGKPRRKTVSK